MYADDTHITYADVDVNSTQLNLNHDLGNLNKWLISSKLTLNTTKTEFMLIRSKQQLSTLSSQPELSIDNVPIEKVTSVKSLGIFIDENLRWQAHTDKLSKTFPSGAIKRIRDFVPTPTLHCIYNALIQSQFDYCNIVWGNCGKTLFDRLQKLQNRAARVLTFTRYDADSKRLFRQLKWKDLSTQFQIQKALMVYKSSNRLVPGYLSSKFVKRYQTHYSLGNSVNKPIGKFRIPRRPWDEHDCEANAGQLLYKNKNKHGQFAAESLENDRNLKKSKISKLKLYQ